MRGASYRDFEALRPGTRIVVPREG
jgi:hypothetical protein